MSPIFTRKNPLDIQGRIRYSEHREVELLIKFYDKDDLVSVVNSIIRMHDIDTKIQKGEKLTDEEEKYLKIYLGVDKIRDEEHRDKLIKQFWREVRILAKRFQFDFK
ncbi:MAG: hypothetical protein JSW00_10355 [Thermoplasmata archaeon]|nr:MAG: hypothetical protein JSW00_10355 [Thermoplasmata archaeon]